MKRVLVYEWLSGGGGSSAGAPAPDSELLAQGLAMRDALAADLALRGDFAVSVACGPGVPPPPGRLASVAPQCCETAAAFLARLSAAHDAVWVVAPETGGLLAALHAAVGAARWVGCTAAALRLTSSKRATSARLAAEGIATPNALEAAPEVRRWVVKPDDGAGALASRLHVRHDAARADQAGRPQAAAPAVLEPWVEGEALSLSLLCAGGQAKLLSVNRQRIEVGAGGVLAFEGVSINALGPNDPRRAALRATAVQVARAIPGLRGYVGVDLVWHAVLGPVVIEVNPRLTSAYVGLSAALQRNLAAEVLELHDRERLHDAA